MIPGHSLKNGRKAKDAETELAGSKSMRQMRERVYTAPKQVVAEHLRTMRTQLGVEPGESWQPWQWRGIDAPAGHAVRMRR